MSATAIQKRPRGAPKRIPDRIQSAISISRSDRELLDELGGSAWIRQQIAKARKERETSKEA